MRTIVQKFDRRRREKKFFSIPVLPLIIVIILAITLFFLPNKIVSKVSMNGTFLQLDKTVYRSNQQLEGKLKINLSQGDFLPLNSQIIFRMFAYFPWYYVCEDGSVHEWCDVNGTSLISNQYCDAASIPYIDYPEQVLCNGVTALEPRDCEAYNKTCCPYGVAGKVYINLNCSGTPEPFGYCGDTCIVTQDVFTLQQLIQKSTTPNKGNFTNSLYRYWNGTHSITFPGQPSGPGVGYCEFQNFQNRSEFLTCKDTDGDNPYIKGMCSDWLGNNYEDFCNGSNVIEWRCERPLVKEYNCSSCGKAKCLYPGTDSEGWYAECPSGSNNLILIKYAECAGLNESYAPICNTSSVPGWYDPHICMNFSFTCQQCEDGACKTNCSDWNNSYEIPLRNLYTLGLQKTPDKNAYYLLVVNFKYNNTFIVPKDTITAGFFVAEQPRHKKCVNYRCVYVVGEGNDECSSNADCCEPNWSYGPWSQCINGVQYRNVTDLNGCLPSRIESQQCQTCVPAWQCFWQPCNDTIQRKVCQDINHCDPFNSSYIAETRACCVEEWICSRWSKCENGFQTRRCQEIKGCNTTFNKPIERQECRETKDVLLYALIVIIAVVIIFLLVIRPKLITSFSRKYFVTKMTKTFPSFEEMATPMPKKSPREFIKEKSEEKVKFEELVDYIKKALRTGFSRDEIEKSLLEKGWSKSTIDKAFETLLA